MLLQLKLHFTSLLPNPYDINTALFTTTLTDHAGLPPLHLVRVTQCITPWITAGVTRRVGGSSGYIASGRLCVFSVLLLR